MNVGNPLSEGITCFYTREFTQEKGLTSVVNAGNLLTIDGHSFNTREFIQEKSLMCAVNVGNRFITQWLWITTAQQKQNIEPAVEANYVILSF